MLRSAALAATVALALGFAVRNWLVDNLIFQPSPGVDITPAELGLTGEEVYLTAEDGVRIHAFYLPAHPPEPAASRAMLFLHGNAGNASHRLPNAAELVRLGTSVLLLDYRGYGRSEGRPSEEGVYADARAGLAHLTGALGYPERRVVVFGRSLGSAVAVDLARDRELGGLILESAWTRLSDVAGRIASRAFAPLVGGRFAPEAKIGRVRAPLLFFHGDRDELVDFELGRRLFEAAHPPKAFETIAGAGHNDTVEVGGRAYFERIRRFLDEVVPGP